MRYMTEAEQTEVFRGWMDRYKGLVFRIVRAYAETSMDRDDLFQEIAIQLWKSVPAFRRQSADTTWIYRISLNTAIKWSTKVKRNSGSRPIEEAQHLLNEVSKDDRLEWLYGMIAKFDEIDRSLTLLMLDGFSYREMANMLGITESNVGVKINRIKKRLVTESKQYNYD